MLTDAVAREIVTAGWANQSGGDVEAPTGHFSLIVIEPEEVDEMQKALDLEVEPGAYVVVEDSLGFVHVHEHTHPLRAEANFRALQHQFSFWSAS